MKFAPRFAECFVLNLRGELLMTTMNSIPGFAEVLERQLEEPLFTNVIKEFLRLMAVIKRLEGNNLPELRRIFVRLQGVPTGA
ncbi:MAG: hypothetical protein GY801_46170 [bacterium]|nr:hypothetical protein [bacterium]